MTILDCVIFVAGEVQTTFKVQSTSPTSYGHPSSLYKLELTDAELATDSVRSALSSFDGSTAAGSATNACRAYELGTTPPLTRRARGRLRGRASCRG
jgi:hypothetical protein